MILNTATLTPELHKQAIQTAEEIFKTQSHPDQMQASEENFERLKSISPDSILYEVGVGGKLMGWVVMIPTSKELARAFVDKKVGEQALLEMTKPATTYDAVYLCAAVTLPEYRRQGIATALTKEALKRFSLTPDVEFFAWPTSKEGASVIKKLEGETGKVIHIRI